MSRSACTASSWARSGWLKLAAAPGATCRRRSTPWRSISRSNPGSKPSRSRPSTDDPILFHSSTDHDSFPSLRQGCRDYRRHWRHRLRHGQGAGRYRRQCRADRARCGPHGKCRERVASGQPSGGTRGSRRQRHIASACRRRASPLWPRGYSRQHVRLHACNSAWGSRRPRRCPDRRDVRH
ncbi:hypothetical protein D3C86_1534410 [compost metagenome]